MECYYGGRSNGKLDLVLRKYQETDFFDIDKDEICSISEYRIVNNVDRLIESCVMKHMSIEDILNLFHNEHIIIGNDILNGVVPIDKERRNLRDLVGVIYQELSRKSTNVYRVTYGIETQLKPKRNLIVTTDCAGSIGEKKQDKVSVDYQTLAYFTARNALIDMMSKNGTPQTLVYSNFCGDESLGDLLMGTNKALKEAEVTCNITGSTESNFSMNESAFSVSLVGYETLKVDKDYSCYAVIGMPLVGEEVLQYPELIVSLKEVEILRNHPSVSKVLQIGSKGINDRAKTVLNYTFESDMIDLNKSAGPSTCVLVECKDLDILKKIVKTQITEIQRG